MTTPEFTAKELNRLKRIEALVSSAPANDQPFTTKVRNQFTAAAIRKAFTPEEIKAQVDLLKEGIAQEFYSLPASDEKNAKRAIMSLKVSDIFVSVSRRVANDDKVLAGLLSGRFYKKDPELLEKAGLKSLAALVRENWRFKALSGS